MNSSIFNKKMIAQEGGGERGEGGEGDGGGEGGGVANETVVD